MQPTSLYKLTGESSSVPTFRCSQCAFQKQVSIDLVGKKARCPKCKIVSVIANEPVVQDVITIEDDDPDGTWTDLQGELDPVNNDTYALASEDLPPRSKKKREDNGISGIPTAIAR